MAKGHRLRDLQMRKAWHHGRSVPVSELHQRPAESLEQHDDLVDRRA